jgi:hypothetical protein
VVCCPMRLTDVASSAEQDGSPMKILDALVTFVLMVVCAVVCGIGGYAATGVFLWIVGSSLHHDVSYNWKFPVTLLPYGGGAIGFLAPVVYLGPGVIGNLVDQQRPWQFSLRTLLIAATIIAVILGLAVLLYRSL